MKIIEKNEIVSIEELSQNDFNPKNIEEKNPAYYETVRNLEKSIESFGQIKPVNVRELEDGKFEIIDGFHTWVAMRNLGFKEIEIKNLGKIDYKEAVGICLSMERIKNEVDEIEEARLIKNLVQDKKIKIEELEKIVPFSTDELKEKIELITYEFKEPEEIIEEEDIELPSTIFKIDMGTVKKLEEIERLVKGREELVVEIILKALQK